MCERDLKSAREFRSVKRWSPSSPTGGGSNWDSGVSVRICADASFGGIMISLVQIKDGITKNTDKNKKGWSKKNKTPDTDRANAASQALWFKRLCLSFSSFLSTCELMNFLLSHCRLLVDYLSYGFMDARRHWACSTQHLLCMSRLSVMSVFQRGSISIHISTETSAVCLYCKYEGRHKRISAV